MKYLLSLLLFICIISAKAQETEMVGFRCYFYGASTFVVYEFENLIISKKYDQILLHLDSEDPAYVFMSTFSLESLAKHNLLKLEKETKKKIKLNKKLKLYIETCSGCEVGTSLKIKDVFSKSNKKYSFLKQGDRWFEEILKKLNEV